MSPSTESVELFRRLVEEKHNDVVAKLDLLMEAYAYGAKDRINTDTKKLLQASQALTNALAVGDRPVWLKGLVARTQDYMSNVQDAQRNIAQLTFLRENFNRIKEHDWQLDGGPPSPLADFDEVVARYVAESRIEELITKLVSTLQEILDSDLVDSRSATEALRTLLATLTGPREKSFFSKALSFRFVRIYSRNLFKAYLKKIDKLSPFVEAWDESVEELDSEIEIVQDRLKDWTDEMGRDWSEQLQEKLPGLEFNRLPDQSDALAQHRKWSDQLDGSPRAAELRLPPGSSDGD